MKYVRTISKPTPILKQLTINYHFPNNFRSKHNEIIEEIFNVDDSPIKLFIKIISKNITIIIKMKKNSNFCLYIIK